MFLSPIEIHLEPFQERLLEQIALARQLGRTGTSSSPPPQPKTVIAAPVESGLVAWLFHRASGFSTAYIGSSNLTHSALLPQGPSPVVAAGVQQLDQHPRLEQSRLIRCRARGTRPARRFRATRGGVAARTHMSKSLGPLLVSCAMSLAACDVVDQSDDDPAGISEEDLEDPAEMSEGDVARLTNEHEPEVWPEKVDALDYRYYLSWGSCHTYWWMADQAALYCQAIGSHYAYNYNFTYSCQGWWGDGARKVWFSCGRFN